MSDPLLDPEARAARAKAFLPAPDLTFPAVFEQRARHQPEATAFFEVVFDRRVPRAVPHAFGDLVRGARVGASVLASAGAGPNDRVLLCLEKPPTFLAHFLASQILGAIPVPLPSASEACSFQGVVERLRAVIASSGAKVVVVDSSEAATVIGSQLPGVAVIFPSSPELAPEPMAGDGGSFLRSPEEIAFLQYTSGSTGAPKGVIVTHANLVANMRASTEAAGFGSDDRSFSWLPLFHDMGLIGGLLLGQYLGIPTYVMPTKSFAGRPDSWLRAMTAFKATYACAPNFAYDLLAHRLPDSALAGLDLSAWRLAFDGAEPVDRRTLEAFALRYAAVGLRPNAMFPVYGLAECTLAAAFGTPGAPVRYDTVDRHLLATTGIAKPVGTGEAGAVVFTSVGQPLPGHSVEVWEEGTKGALPERHVGEVVVRGPSVTAGYFGLVKEAATELRTGDLGYLAGGDLFIVDRLKDVIIAAGRNLIPSDVERAVSRLPGARHGSVVAFSAPRDGSEVLCLLVGAEPAALHDPAFPALVRQAVIELCDVAPAEVLIVKPGTVPKTTSGKIQRRACRELYLTGAFTRPR